MFMRRAVPAIVVLGLVVGLFATTGLVSAQEASESAQPSETLGGSVTWRDTTGLSDSVVIALTGVPQPAAGTSYYGWLIADDKTETSVGELAVSAAGAVDVTYNAPDGANLLATHHTFVISSSDQSAAPALYSSNVPADALLPLRSLLVGLATNPDGKGIAVGLREQTQMALDRANLAMASTTPADKQLYLKQVINIIGGSMSSDYDASAGDEGDGFGVLNYAAAAIDQANLAKTAVPDNETVAAQADAVVASVNNATAAATAAWNNAVWGVAQIDDEVILDLALTNVVLNLNKAIDGVDDNGDGVPGNAGAEGGTKRAYIEAQDIAKLVLVKGEPPDVVPPVLPDTGDVSAGLAALGVMIAGLALLMAGALLLRRRGATAA